MRQTDSVLEIVIVVIAGLLLGLVAFALVGLLRVRGLRTRHRARLATVQPRHSEPATLVGIASEGRASGRTVGTLAVGDSHLLFAQLVPERDLLVPRDAVTSARATRHFLGRTADAEVLVVTWDVDGLSDAAAFGVPDVGDWVARLV